MELGSLEASFPREMLTSPQLAVDWNIGHPKVVRTLTFRKPTPLLREHKHTHTQTHKLL
jgi:hypothetical protein